MHIIITGRNIDVSQHSTNYVEKRLQKLERHVPDVGDVNVELVVNKTRSLNDGFGCEITFFLDTRLLRAEATSADLYKSVDSAVDKAMHQLDKVKARHRHKGRASVAANMVALQEEEEAAIAYADEIQFGRIVRSKEFSVDVMDPEEAIEQMEMLGHDFFLFAHPDTSGISLIYKRRDDQYGLLQPYVDDQDNLYGS